MGGAAHETGGDGACGEGFQVHGVEGGVLGWRGEVDGAVCEVGEGGGGGGVGG